MKLSNDIYSKITYLSQIGDELFEQNLLKEALDKYKQALDLIPSPKNNWEASISLYVAIGDVYFFEKNFLEASSYFYYAANLNITNPFLNLRMGQCQLELGDEIKAVDYLLRAYMLEGENIFDDEDRKYILFLKSKVLL